MKLKNLRTIASILTVSAVAGVIALQYQPMVLALQLIDTSP